MTERSAEERFIEAMRHLNGNPETWKRDAIYAFSDAVCELSVHKVGFGGDTSDCGLRASKTLNQAILDAYPNSIPLRPYSEEKSKEHATCRAKLLKRAMGGER